MNFKKVKKNLRLSIESKVSVPINESIVFFFRFLKAKKPTNITVLEKENYDK